MLCSFENPEAIPCKASCSFLWTPWDVCTPLWDVCNSARCSTVQGEQHPMLVTASVACQVALMFLLWLQGVLGHTLSPVRQLFERIASPNAAADAESRFQHFKKHVWLRIKESGSTGNDCHNLCKQVSGAALMLCLSVLRCRLPCCWSLLSFAGCLLQSIPCKRAVHAAEHSLQACCECSS